jgi:hypothetical protein
MLNLLIKMSILAFGLTVCVPLHASPIGGVMEFAGQLESFGTVYQGQKLRHRFKFKNAGDGPLRLKGVYAACGCTVAEFDKESVYAPGQEGGIDVTFDSSHFAGKVSKAVTVMTDERGIPERLLTITANVIEEYQVTPPVVDFGDISTAAGGTQKIMVRPVNGFQLEVKGAEYDSKIFDVQIKQEGNNWMIEFALKRNQQSGFFRQDIYILTNSTKMPKFLVPIRANIKGNIAYGPEYLEFGAVARDESIKRLIKLDLLGKFHIVQTSTQLHINGNQIKDEHPYLSVEVPKEGDKGGDVSVRLSNKSEFAGSVHGSIQIETDDPMQKEIKVDFYAYFR